MFKVIKNLPTFRVFSLMTVYRRLGLLNVRVANLTHGNPAHLRSCCFQIMMYSSYLVSGLCNRLRSHEDEKVTTALGECGVKKGVGRC